VVMVAVAAAVVAAIAIDPAPSGAGSPRRSKRSLRRLLFTDFLLGDPVWEHAPGVLNPAGFSHLTLVGNC
jgi:hypothetical protein